LTGISADLQKKVFSLFCPLFLIFKNMCQKQARILARKPALAPRLSFHFVTLKMKIQ